MGRVGRGRGSGAGHGGGLLLHGRVCYGAVVGEGVVTEPLGWGRCGRAAVAVGGGVGVGGGALDAVGLGGAVRGAVQAVGHVGAAWVGKGARWQEG